MNRIVTEAALFALVGMSGMHSPAQAANLVQFRDTSNGRGSIRLPDGRSDQLRRAEVVFQRGGVGSVRLIGDRTYQFNGRWSNGSGQRLEFRISRAFDDDEPGDATIRFRGDSELTEITVTSRARSRSYSANFKSDRDGGNDGDWDGGWDNSSVSGRGNGKGTLKIESKDDERLRRYSVELRKGGEATLTLQGERDPRVLRGRWRSVDNRTAEIRLEEIFGDKGDDSRGRLKLYFTGGNNQTRRLDRLEGQGKSRNRDFSLNFDTDNQGGGGSGGGNRPGGELGVIATRKGTGNLNITGRRDEFLKEASVRLERNGDATFRFTTDEASFTVQGKWYKRPNSANMLDVDIDRYGDASASGRGTVELSFGGTRSFSRIELNGQTGGSKLVVSFRAQ